MNQRAGEPAPSESKAADGDGPAMPAPRLRLRSLKVHEFRDVRPGTELQFGDGFHLVLGKNASGKSTLLELLAAVSTLSFRRPFFAETPFHLVASFEVGNISLDAEIKRTFKLPSSQRTDLNLEFPPQEEARATVRVELRAPSFPFRQWVDARTGQGLFVLQADPIQQESAPLIRLLSGVDPLGLSTGLALGMGFFHGSSVHAEARSAFLHLSTHPGTGTPFDEALGALRAMAGNGMSFVRGDPPHFSTPWLPPALDFNARGEPVEVDLSVHPLLKSAILSLGFDGAKIYFGPGAKSFDNRWTYSNPSFQFFRGGKAVRRHDQLSFGQQRLFSFAWYLACNPDVAVADELVNGLHSEWLDWCVDALGDRQCFLTSQNPLLVDAVPLTSKEDVRRGIILCESAKDTGQLSWRQLDDREADLIGSALGQSRLDLLSDLLHALDLW